MADALLGVRCSADVTLSVSIGMLSMDTRTRAGVDHLIDQVLALGLLVHGGGQHPLVVVEGGAEYAEDQATVDYLTRAGIDYAQGLAVGMPAALGGDEEAP